MKEAKERNVKLLTGIFRKTKSKMLSICPRPENRQ